MAVRILEKPAEQTTRCWRCGYQLGFTDEDLEEAPHRGGRYLKCPREECNHRNFIKY